MSRIQKDAPLDPKKNLPSVQDPLADARPAEPDPAPAPEPEPEPPAMRAPSRASQSKDDQFGDLLSPQDPSEYGLSQKAIRMKRHLDKQPRVPLLIPREKSDPVGATAFFGINSYKYYVLKGEVVHVPEQIAQMYYASIGAEDSVLRNHKLNLANQGSEASRHALNY